MALQTQKQYLSFVAILLSIRYIFSITYCLLIQDAISYGGQIFAFPSLYNSTNIHIDQGLK